MTFDEYLVSKKTNMRKFCQLHGLPYLKVWKLVNKKAKRLNPLLIESIKDATRGKVKITDWI